MGRAGFVLGEAAARGGCLAAVAWASSPSSLDDALRFLSTWTVLFAGAAAIFGLAELPLLLAAGTSRGRAALVAAAAGLLWGALIARVVPAAGPHGIWAPLAVAAGGAAASLAWRPAARRGGRVTFALGLALALALAAVALWLDPAGRYAARHETGGARCRAERPAVALDDGAPPSAAVARAWMCGNPPESLPWSWQESVAVEGLLAQGRCGGDPAPLEYARRWVAAHRRQARGAPLWADSAAPLAVVAAVTDPEAGDELLRDFERRVRRRAAPRARSGALSHLGDLLGGRLPPQVWVDSLFMYGVTLDRLFERRGERWALDEARRLGLGVAQALQGPEGLMRHGRFEAGPLGLTLPVERTFWARGNAWAAYFLADHQRVRLARGLAPDPDLGRSFVRMLDPLLAAQDPETGLWRTDLSGVGDGEGRNPFETSASALLVAAFAVADREGLGSRPLGAAVERGRRGVRSRVRWDGGRPVVIGTSGSTVPGYRAYYRGVAARDDLGHGVGAVLLALTSACEEPGVAGGQAPPGTIDRQYDVPPASRHSR